MSNFRTTSFKEGCEPFVMATIKQDIPKWNRKVGEREEVCCIKFRGEEDKYQIYSYYNFRRKLVFMSGNQEKLEQFFDFDEKVVVTLEK